VSDQEYIEQARRAKATHLAVHLENARPWCRACREELVQNDDEEWVTLHRVPLRYCRAPGFVKSGLVVAHRPDPWTPSRVAHLDREERARVAADAGKREPSKETWQVVVELFTALYERRHPEHENPHSIQRDIPRPF
jgi:hypothetical protein